MNKRVLVLIFTAISPLPLYLIQGSINGSFSISFMLTDKIIKFGLIGPFLEEIAKIIPLYLFMIGNLKKQELNKKQIINLTLISTFLFAIFENILYSIDSDFSLILRRFLSAMPLHIVATGSGVMIMLQVIKKNQTNNRIKPLLYGFMIAWITHGVYNLLLILADYYQSPALVVLLRCLSILLIFIAGLILFVKQFKADDKNQIGY